MEHKSISKIAFAILIVIALSALSFRFTPNGIFFLADSPLGWLIASGALAAILLLLLWGKNMVRKRLWFTGIMYSLVPFGFTFSSTDSTSFIFLSSHLIYAVCLWVVAATALIMAYVKQVQPPISI